MICSMEHVDINAIRNIRITDLLGLPRTNRQMSIKCPCYGHIDGTPSFSIYPDNSYFCFGCRKSGKGAISLLMDATGCTFKEALQELQTMV